MPVLGEGRVRHVQKAQTPHRVVGLVQVNARRHLAQAEAAHEDGDEQEQAKDERLSSIQIPLRTGGAQPESGYEQPQPHQPGYEGSVTGGVEIEIHEAQQKGEETKPDQEQGDPAQPPFRDQTPFIGLASSWRDHQQAQASQREEEDSIYGWTVLREKRLADKGQSQGQCDC
jgi:hypothetical protein